MRVPADADTYDLDVAGDRRGDHPGDARGHRELARTTRAGGSIRAEQLDDLARGADDAASQRDGRPDLPASPTRRTTGSSSTAASSRRPSRATRTRSCSYTYAQDAPGAGIAHRVPRDAARDARTRGARTALLMPARSSTGWASRARPCSTPCRRSRRIDAGIDRLQRAPRPRRAGARDRRATTCRARGHVLRPRPLADRRRSGVLRSGSRDHDVYVLPGSMFEIAGAVPDLAHGQRRHGRARDPAVRRGDRARPAGEHAHLRAARGGEFEPWTREIDRWLMNRAGGDGTVLVAPTAAAAPRATRCSTDGPRRALAHFDERRGPTRRVLPLRTRADAATRGPSSTRSTAASLVYFSGGNPWYLAETLRGTAVLGDHAERRLDEGLAYAGCSAGVACLTERTFDSDDGGLRRQIFKPGLGYAPSGRRSSARTGTWSTTGCPGRRDAHRGDGARRRRPDRHRRGHRAGRRRRRLEVVGRQRCSRPARRARGSDVAPATLFDLPLGPLGDAAELAVRRPTAGSIRGVPASTHATRCLATDPIDDPRARGDRAGACRPPTPTRSVALRFTNPLECLVATILSAQCTDEKVNEVTRDAVPRSTARPRTTSRCRRTS